MYNFNGEFAFICFNFLSTSFFFFNLKLI